MIENSMTHYGALKIQMESTCPETLNKLNWFNKDWSLDNWGDFKLLYTLQINNIYSENTKLLKMFYLATRCARCNNKPWKGNACVLLHGLWIKIQITRLPIRRNLKLFAVCIVQNRHCIQPLKPLANYN